MCIFTLTFVFSLHVEDDIRPLGFARSLYRCRGCACTRTPAQVVAKQRDCVLKSRSLKTTIRNVWHQQCWTHVTSESNMMRVARQPAALTLPTREAPLCATPPSVGCETQKHPKTLPEVGQPTAITLPTPTARGLGSKRARPIRGWPLQEGGAQRKHRAHTHKPRASAGNGTRWRWEGRELGVDQR